MAFHVQMVALMLTTRLSVVLVPALFAVAACAPSQTVPADANVQTLQTQSVVLRGTAPANGGSLSCADAAPGGSASYLELKEDVTANVALRPMAGVAVLHVTNVATHKTWCVMTKGDGTGAMIPGEFGMGVYAIDVQCSRTDAAQPYAVQFEKL